MRYLWLVAFATTISTACFFAACSASNDENTTQGSGGSTTGTVGQGASPEGGGPASSSTTGIDFDGGSDACPTAVTCQDVGANCGSISDGCQGIIDCGTCPSGQSCGGGGTPSVCGTPACTPIDCASQNIHCGPAGDGCGNVLDCGSCPTGQVCGGGGPGLCGGNTCTPVTCQDLGFTCGPAGDGCGGQLDCGQCTAPATCGGGGQPSVCGAPTCMAKTCADFGANACGPIGDGCGGLLQCGSCTSPATCGGGGTPSVCGVPNTCTNLCLKQTTCPNGGTTSLTGTVYAPNGVDPLPNVLVYVPNSAVQAFTAGVSCDKCSSGVTGSPLVSAATDTAGHFTITNMPVGTNIPLVIQTGRWRRQVVISNVSACTVNTVPATLTHLPQNKSQGDIPKMAFATGSVDVLECVLRKVGVQDTEFTQPGGTGRINLYVGDGSVKIIGPGGGTFQIGGANAGSGTPSETTLVNSLSTLEQYDMVLFPRKGADETSDPGGLNLRTAAQLSNMINYANAGGRIFTTHFSYSWIYKNGNWNNTAQWQTNQCDPATSPDGCATQMGYPPDQNGHIIQTFPKGQALAQWLVNIGASTTLGLIPLNTLRDDANGVNAPSQEWLYATDPKHIVMHYTFNTPVGSPSDQQCGRVLFDDFHVENHGFINQNSAYGMTFPAECVAGAMTPQEKLLEFMIFDLGSCVTPDIPVCTKTTCAAQNIGCGPAGDGCGGILQCGTCPTGQTCGGGGVPSQCGAPSCTPKTCAQQGIQCGPAGDGCGGLLQCGNCPSGQTCGGSGMAGICGSGSCTPLTCAQQGISCGPAGDGCGNLLACGNCPAGQSCGGGGTPGVCGSLCTPLTCLQLGFNCGLAGDGCGGTIDCGTCALPQTCGGGGVPNVCGGSVPK